MMLLAGDIGGTKTSLGIYSAEKGPLAPLIEETFLSRNYVTLEELLAEFLSRHAADVECACFAVAGPVFRGRVKVTNLPWIIDEVLLRKKFNLKFVHLLNDLAAIAYSVPRLTVKDLHTINKGTPDDRGAIAVIAPGTGLGEAFLAWDGLQYQAYPSEGGHCDFAPNSPLEMELLRYLKEKWGHVSYERICSGMGLPNIYKFLKKCGYAAEPSWLHKEISSAQDPTPIIVNRAFAGDVKCVLCESSVKLFVSVLGAEAGNLALKVLATGGVYLGGGISPRIIRALEKGQFMEVFTAKGRFSRLMSDIPVHVILNQKTAITGAAFYGLLLSKT